MIAMRFSVIIPLYNKAPYVGKALQSVLDQSFTDFELIVVDDGSTDESARVVETVLSEANVDCQLIRQENAGVSAARNNGVARSRGDFLCFLDADDWWAPSFLAEMSALIDEYPEAGIYGTGYVIVNETKRKTRVAPLGLEPGFEKGYIDYCRVYAKTMAMPLTSISVAMPRRVFDEMGGFPAGVKLGEDFLLWVRTALHHQVAFLNKPLAFYNQDVDAQFRAVGRLHEPRAHMLWNLGFLEEEEKDNPALKQLIDNLRTINLISYLLHGQYREDARRELAKVDWTRQPKKTRDLYRKPIPYLAVRQWILCQGARVKQWIVKHR